MDARRYDRNADLLAQIYWHMNKKTHTTHERAEIMRQNMLVMLQACLDINDELGKLTEKGLI